MLFLYNTGIYLYTLFIRIVSFNNKKAAAWINGRKGLLELIEKNLDKSKRYTWFHFASLGEFEQGSPVLEQLKSENPELPIVITFFSPSGYEIRKNYALADYVFYLPVDTKTNAVEFIRLLNPTIAIFTKSGCGIGPHAAVLYKDDVQISSPTSFPSIFIALLSTSSVLGWLPPASKMTLSVCTIVSN